MGLRANYQYLSDKDVKELRSFYVGESGVFEEVYIRILGIMKKKQMK